MVVWIYLWIIIVHFVSDFVMQTDWQARNKAINNDALWEHVRSYTGTTAIGWLPLYFICSRACLLPAALILIALSHAITDYFTSKVNKYLWTRGRVHDFFVSVGFDQVLHYMQLFLIWYYILN